MENKKCSLLKTITLAGINFCRRVWAFEKVLMKKIISRRESAMTHRVEFVFGKVDPWVLKKSNSAKEISLTELKEL